MGGNNSCERQYYPDIRRMAEPYRAAAEATRGRANPHPPASSSFGAGRRCCFRAARRDLAARRRRLAAAVGLVGRRGIGGAAARRIRAIRRSSASWRLRSWVRKRRAVMTRTPSWVRRRPARRAARSRRLGRQGHGVREIEAQLHRGRDLVDVLSAGAGGADKAFLDLAVIEDDIAYYRDHGAAQRGILPRHRNIALHAA